MSFVVLLISVVTVLISVRVEPFCWTAALISEFTALRLSIHSQIAVAQSGSVGVGGGVVSGVSNKTSVELGLLVVALIAYISL
jgi:hypothetical protein